MTGEMMMRAAMTQRERNGLKCVWALPDGSTFTAYARDAAQKAAWLKSAAAKGWRLQD